MAAAIALASVAAGAQAADWPMYGHDVSGSRHARGETALDRPTARRLAISWTFRTPGAVNGTPAVVDGTVYVGDSVWAGPEPATGSMYALNARSGALRWLSPAGSPITASPLVSGRLVIVGDNAGYIHGLDRVTGRPAWPAIRPNTTHSSVGIFGSAIPAGRLVVVGISSNEEAFAMGNRAGLPIYPCCSFRGSLAAIDPATGRLVWQTYTITTEERRHGSSGATIWSTPSYDPKTRRIYVTTGNNYSDPATQTSDAMLCVDARTGRIVWRRQLWPNDVWSWKYPTTEEHPDFDFGDSPKIFRLRSGRKVVAAGQKSGFFHLLDARTGRLIHSLQVERGGPFGGLFATGAYARGVVYANGNDWKVDPVACHPCEGGTGHLFAIAARRSRLKQQWRMATPGSPNMGGVAVANGVVYFVSSRAGPGGAAKLYALDSRSGAVLTSVSLGEAALSGPAVADGAVYAGTGDSAGYFVSNHSQYGSVVALRPADGRR